MRRDGEWMTDEELEAAAKCFKIHIYVLDMELSPSIFQNKKLQLF